MARLVAELPGEVVAVLEALLRKYGRLEGLRCKAEVSRTRQRPPYWAFAGEDGEEERPVYLRVRVRCCPRGSSRGCMVYTVDGGVPGEVEEERLARERERLARIAAVVNRVIELIEVLGERARLEGLEHWAPVDTGDSQRHPAPALGGLEGHQQSSPGAPVGHLDREGEEVTE